MILLSGLGTRIQFFCTWVKVSQEKYTFDITKSDKVFDLLLQKGQLQLSTNHMIPSAEEHKKKKYCKFHNSISNDTKDCKFFGQQVQSTINQGRIKFEETKKSMKIDGHPFPTDTNMIEITMVKEKTKVLTSARAKESEAVDPKL